MDDSCAVCADSLEWVAYGSCGHREVCSTCVVRLRFVLCDPRCCICKTESPVIFVTKALGDYTRTINDFSTFPTAPKEGRVAGGFWYHEDTQAFFDDLDQYRMIKAMCRLSCSVCDKAEEEQGGGGGGGGPRHRLRIKSVEQLKGHLYHKHKLNMCNLCLEGRKIFIGEQKLYTRAQLNQHIHTGDSEVDGSESERGGFAGHPMCEFCRNPFYGDNELYTHMTTEHYTCHICQRSQTGKYEYYKNYDDLELHFRRDHFLCEDDSCLSKKFIVFPNESELKRHNAIEHGGRMSRAQRTAALQIPTSFRYSRGNDQESRRGRPRSFRREPGGGDDNYNRAVNAALRLSEAEYSRQEPPPPSSAPPPGFSENNNRDMDDGDPLIQPMESLSTTDMEPSSRYLQAVGSSGGGGSRLQESAFPPLAGQPRSGQNLEGLPTNTLAARLRRQTNRTPSATAIASPSQAWPAVNRASNTSGGGGGNPSSGWPAIGRAPVQASSSSAQSRSHARVAQPRPPNSQAARNGNMIPHSSSAPNLSDTRSLHSEFPPVSAAARKTPSSTITQGTSNSQPPPPDVQSANKSLVEQMRSALGHDEELFMTFKDVSGQYRQGSIDATTYLEYVKGYGLSHLVIDLARLCPDPRRQKELIDAHTASLRNNAAKENGPAAAAGGQSSSSQAQESKKNKGKAVKVADPKEAVADNFMETVRRLQSSQNFHEEEEEVISKDKNAYRSDKGKSKVESTSTGSKQQRKKTSKFHRVRLGDGSMAALLNVNSSYHEPEPESKDDNNNNSQNQTGVRGVWRKGGAQLFS